MFLKWKIINLFLGFLSSWYFVVIVRILFGMWIFGIIFLWECKFVLIVLVKVEFYDKFYLWFYKVVV